MKKRLFAIMLALAMLLVAVPALAEGEGEHTHDGESAPTYVDNRDGTHKVIYNCGVVKDVSVKHTFNDGKCVCGAEQSVASQPEGQQPATNEPAAQQPAASQPEGQQPATNEPSTQQPTDSQSGGQNPSTNGGGEGGGTTGGETEGGTTGGGETGGETDGGSTGTGDSGTTPATCTHAWGAPVWAWSDNYSDATATFKCTRCGERQAIPATVNTSNEYSNCYVYTKYTAKVTGPDGKEYPDSKTTNCRRPDWYYDPCYYNNPCGHWGCGNVCTRYSNCVPCQNYRTTFRVGGYNCLATPKTGDVSVIGMALISLAGAGAAIMGKKRK